MLSKLSGVHQPVRAATCRRHGFSFASSPIAHRSLAAPGDRGAGLGVASSGCFSQFASPANAPHVDTWGVNLPERMLDAYDLEHPAASMMSASFTLPSPGSTSRAK